MALLTDSHQRQNTATAVFAEPRVQAVQDLWLLCCAPAAHAPRLQVNTHNVNQVFGDASRTGACELRLAAPAVWCSYHALFSLCPFYGYHRCVGPTWSTRTTSPDPIMATSPAYLSTTRSTMPCSNQSIQTPGKRWINQINRINRINDHNQLNQLNQRSTMP